MSDDFCLIHGYEYMRTRFGEVVAHCEMCEALCRNAADQDGGFAVSRDEAEELVDRLCDDLTAWERSGYRHAKDYEEYRKSRESVINALCSAGDQRRPGEQIIEATRKLASR